MKKLVKGIVEFRRTTWANYKDMFAKLALGQSPDTLFIACSDSRVVPNLFASSDPGDLFVVRNVGNLIPCCGKDGHSTADESEAAAIEFALEQLNVKDIIVCGHSECGAMQAILGGRKKVTLPNLQSWLRHGEPALAKMGEDSKRAQKLAEAESQPLSLTPLNQLSLMNVLQQIEHLVSYPLVKSRIREGRLGIHGWWFELKTASVYAYDPESEKFLLIDEDLAQQILAKLS